jgi:hypothetical protein
MHLELNDYKVLLANIFCFIAVEIASLNAVLQSLMLGATITYTVVRIMNEYKKYKGQ